MAAGNSPRTVAERRSRNYCGAKPPFDRLLRACLRVPVVALAPVCNRPRTQCHHWLRAIPGGARRDGSRPWEGWHPGVVEADGALACEACVVRGGTPAPLLLPAGSGMGAEAGQAQVLDLFGTLCHNVVGSVKVKFGGVLAAL
jgi:hypothetical protein